MKGDLCDHVVLDPTWLCHSVLGSLLSREAARLAEAEAADPEEAAACFSLVEFQRFLQQVMPQQQAGVDATDMLPILEALGVCTRVRVIMNDGQDQRSLGRCSWIF